MACRVAGTWMTGTLARRTITEDPMARHDVTGPHFPTGSSSAGGLGGPMAVEDEAGLVVPLDRLSPRAAAAAWLASEPRPEIAAALVTAIRGDSRIELDDEEVGAVLRDARSEGLDAETAFERLILQGEWLAMDRLARIRPR